MDRIDYGGWPDCYRLGNGIVDLVVTGDVGPRIIRFGFVGGPNEFMEFPAMLGKTGGNEWRIYGGHRLWHAPEASPRTYAPDNAPVHVEPLQSDNHLWAAGESIRVTQPVEATTGIEKQIDVHLSASAAEARVVHRLTNRGVWPVQLAPWAVTAMPPGGVAIVPLPPRHQPGPDTLLPASALALWPYTDMSDPRWTWGKRYVMLRQRTGAAAPQKVGATQADWIAYARDSRLFVKRIAPPAAAACPDFGCRVETYTDADMLEIETLGPLTVLAPNQCAEHAEHWSLHRNVPPPATEKDVEEHITPIAPQSPLAFSQHP